MTDITEPILLQKDVGDGLAISGAGTPTDPKKLTPDIAGLAAGTPAAGDLVMISQSGTLKKADVANLPDPDAVKSVPPISVLGNPTGSTADSSAVGLHATLEFSGSNMQRAGLTGDVTASAGSNTTNIAAGVVGQAELAEACRHYILAATTQAGTTGQIVNTTTETNLISHTIPSDTIGRSGRVRMRCLGRCLNNSGALNQFTLRCYFGGTNWFIDGQLLAASAVVRPFELIVDVNNLGATDAQHCQGRLLLSSAVAQTAGSGNLDDVLANTNVFGTSSDMAIDTTNDQAFTVSAQWFTASANSWLQVKHLSLECWATA